MTEGYALVAWPAKYDDTGVMTFIVNQDGVVYQKNLGPNTDAAARAINTYDPGRELAEGGRQIGRSQYARVAAPQRSRCLFASADVNRRCGGSRGPGSR